MARTHATYARCNGENAYVSRVRRGGDGALIGPESVVPLEAAVDLDDEELGELLLASLQLLLVSLGIGGGALVVLSHVDVGILYRSRVAARVSTTAVWLGAHQLKHTT
jgi:hypothetical protein